MSSVYGVYETHAAEEKKKQEIYDGPIKGELPAQYEFFRSSVISRVAKMRLRPAQMRVEVISIY